MLTREASGEDRASQRPVDHAARFLDIGILEPAYFHATYTGIAAAAAADAQPAVVWGRARPHISLGASQSREAELAPDLDVEVVTRPLGGGAVWVDESQFCFVLIVPRSRAPRRPAEWAAWGLSPAVATYRSFGLPVIRRGEDLWCGCRKIGGSGSATIGASAVFAGSFLLRFPMEEFARCIATPSPEFGAWLREALPRTMTDWASHAPLPEPAALRGAFRAAVGQCFGWQLVDSRPSAPELEARLEALAEMQEPQGTTVARRVPDGIQLNATSFLTERRCGGATLRELLIDGVRTRHEKEDR